MQILAVLFLRNAREVVEGGPVNCQSLLLCSSSYT